MAETESSKVSIRYAKESTANTQETTGGTVLRRTTGTITPQKQTIRSNEKRDDQQVISMLHGTRSTPATISGEAYVGDYEDFFAAMLREAFAAVSDVTSSAGDEFTISSGTLTRAAGGSESFITDGLRTGMVIRLAGMTETANNNRNLLITAMTATTLDLVALDGGDPVADDAASNDSATLSVPGKDAAIPSSGHTEDTFTIERYDSQTDSSLVSWGNKVGSVSISTQPDNNIDVQFGLQGIDWDILESADAPNFDSPTSAGTGASLTPALGYLRINGASYAVITSVDLEISWELSGQPVVGGNSSPNIYYTPRVSVTGTVNALKENTALEKAFDDETEVEIVLYFEAPGSNPRSFWCFYMHRCKVNGADLNDPDGASILTVPFEAIKPTTETGVEETTIRMQDSALT